MSLLLTVTCQLLNIWIATNVRGTLWNNNFFQPNMFCEKKKSQKRGKIKLFYKIKNKIKIPVFHAFQNLLKDRVAFRQTLDNLPPEITIAISKIKKKKN